MPPLLYRREGLDHPPTSQGGLDPQNRTPGEGTTPQKEVKIWAFLETFCPKTATTASHVTQRTPRLHHSCNAEAIPSTVLRSCYHWWRLQFWPFSAILEIFLGRFANSEHFGHYQPSAGSSFKNEGKRILAFSCRNFLPKSPKWHLADFGGVKKFRSGSFVPGRKSFLLDLATVPQVPPICPSIEPWRWGSAYIPPQAHIPAEGPAAPAGGRAGGRRRSPPRPPRPASGGSCSAPTRTVRAARRPLGFPSLRC